MFKYFFQIALLFFASLGTKEALTQFKNIKTFIGNAHERVYEYPRTQYLTFNLLLLVYSEDL